MTNRLDPLPLENRRFDDDAPRPRRPKLSGASVVAHIGLCISVLFFWIFGALYLRPPLDRMVGYQRFSAAFGAAAMSLLFFLCIATIARFRWARLAMLTWAAVMMVWETVKLLINLFVYSQAYKARSSELIREITAASTNPATQPSQFQGFVSYGLYVIPVLTFLLFGGYAFAVWRVMRGRRAKEELG